MNAPVGEGPWKVMVKSYKYEAYGKATMTKETGTCYTFNIPGLYIYAIKKGLQIDIPENENTITIPERELENAVEGETCYTFVMEDGGKTFTVPERELGRSVEYTPVKNSTGGTRRRNRKTHRRSRRN
jgi:hypothetical protein